MRAQGRLAAMSRRDKARGKGRGRGVSGSNDPNVLDWSMSARNRKTDSDIGASLAMSPAPAGPEAPGEPDASAPLPERAPQRIHLAAEWIWPASAALSFVINAVVAAALIFPPRPSAPGEPEPIPIEIVRLAPQPAAPAAAPAPVQPPAQILEPLPPQPPAAVEQEATLPPPRKKPPEPKAKPKPPLVLQAPPPQQPAPPPAETAAPTAPPSAAPQQEARVPPATLPPNPESRGVINAYAARLRALIEAKKSYPAQALRRQEEGSVTLHILVDHSGRLLQVTASSDAPDILVNAALDAVRAAAPFPSFPSAIERDREAFELPIVFKLE